MDDWKKIAKTARDGFEEGRAKGRRGVLNRPPVNTTMAQVFSRILVDERIVGDLATGALIWEDIGIRFVLRKYWYQIRWAIWKWRNR